MLRYFSILMGLILILSCQTKSKSNGSPDTVDGSGGAIDPGNLRPINKAQREEILKGLPEDTQDEIEKRRLEAEKNEKERPGQKLPYSATTRGYADENSLQYWHMMSLQDTLRFGTIIAPVQGVAATLAKHMVKESGVSFEAKPLIVAIIDGGTNIAHEDLKDYIWTNPEEIPDNQIDDDNNGYIDDIHGWDFVGADVKTDTMEVFREKTRCNETSDVGEYCQRVSADSDALEKKYRSQRESAAGFLSSFAEVQRKYLSTFLSEALLANAPEQRKALLEKLKPSIQLNPDDKDLLAVTGFLLEFGYPFLLRFNDEVKDSEDYFNPSYVKKRTVGNGSNDVVGPRPFHGTHVGSTVVDLVRYLHGADVAKANLKLMILRAVPDGDERDEDVAKAIAYAVGKGARVLQMSFGKPYSSPGGKELVDEALLKAEQTKTLINHSAGNDTRVIEPTNNFPNSWYKKEGRAFTNIIEVGASTIVDGSLIPDNLADFKKENLDLAASFSNYGPQVDIFAPGIYIYAAESREKSQTKGRTFSQGTSMASPVVSGIGATLLIGGLAKDGIQARELILQNTRKCTKEGADGKAAPCSDKVPQGLLDAEKTICAALPKGTCD